MNSGLTFRRGATITALALIVVTAACGGSHHAASPTPTSSTAQGSISATAIPGFQWSPDTSLPALGGGPSSTIAAILPPSEPGSTWLAAGSTLDVAGAVTATSWSSPDAIHWTASSLGPDGTASQVRAATQWGSRQLAVGAVGTGPLQRAAVWVSAGPKQPLLPVGDEATFAAPAATGAANGDAAGTGAEMNQVATGALGIFASGTVNGQLAVWYSSDGSRWTRLSDAERVINSASQPVINDLLVAANGVWAVGSVHNGTQTNAAVWNSTDGIHWYRVTSAQSAFAADGDRVINSIAPLGTGFVAVGGVRSGSQWLPASWISPDGVSWSQASDSFPEAPRPTTDDVGTQATAVTDDLGVGVGLVAVGGSPAAQRVWTSTDGQSWSEIALPAGAADASDWHLGLVAALGTTTVVADNTVGAPRLLVDTNGTWKEVTATPSPFGWPSPQVTPTSLVSDSGVLYLAVNIRTPSKALGSDVFNAAILSSTDGASWQVDAQGGVFSGHQITALLAVQTGLLAAGASVAPTVGADPTAAVWSSTNGLSWTVAPSVSGAFKGVVAAIGASATSSGPTPATIDALARVAGTVVGLGQAGAGAPAASGLALAAPAAAWLDHSGTWQAEGPLDPQTSLATEIVSGACAGPQSVVAVGSSTSGVPGTQAAAWFSDDGTHWQVASVTPTPSSGAAESLVGCLSTGNGYLAYGTSPGTAGAPDPALWQSTDGTTWTRQSITAFAGTGAGPIDDLALQGTTWLATSGAPDPASSAAPPNATEAASAAQLWESSDGGVTWNALDTTSAPWTASLYAVANLVGFVDGNPVVVGSSDGRLTIWQGNESST